MIDPVKAFTLFALALGLSAAEKFAYERLDNITHTWLTNTGVSGAVFPSS